jgi:hypothetical protein
LVGAVGGATIEIGIGGKSRVVIPAERAHTAWTQGFQTALG